MSSKKWVYGLIAGIIAIPLGQAEETQKTSVRFDPQAALTQLYGGNTWKDPRLARHFSSPGSDVVYVSLGFDAPYLEGGHPKHLIVSLLTPEPPEQYSCHACTPLIGAAVFTLAGAKWQIESESTIIEDVALGHRFSLVKTGPDRYGVLVHQLDSHQGYQLDRIDLLLAYKRIMRQALSIGFNESPSPDACGDGAQQSVDLTFNVAGSKEFYDALAVVRENAGQCGHLKATVQRSRYEYAAGDYRLVDH